jgi:hypothetical protein
MKVPFSLSRRVALLFLLVAPAGVWAQTISDDDRSSALSVLYVSRMKFLDSIAGLTAEQLAFKASPERWSIAECAEHITLSEDVIFKMATERVMQTEAVKRDPAVYRPVDAMIRPKVIDRSKKGKAPEMLKPSNKWKTMDEMIAEFKEKRKATMAWVETTKAEARSHAIPNPDFKELDAFQWILLLSAHTERHTLQILEVKADPKYPKSK